MALIVPAMKAGMQEHSDLQVPFDSWLSGKPWASPSDRF